MIALSIPAGHPYCRRIRPVGWEYLADPTDPWWPHPGLDPAHLHEVGAGVDLVHLHFGFEHRTLHEMEAWVDTLDDLGLPLVATVHDLENPHLADNEVHEHHLALLVARATTVLTLTTCAAQEIERRWGRRPTVVAHPPLFVSDRAHPGTERGLVGISFKDRPSVIDPGQVIEPVLDAARQAGGRLVVTFEPSAPADHVATAERMLAGSDGRVEVAPPASDRSFADRLARLHVAVLPYRAGTHSGWLEACRDLGTRVVAPDIGCFGDQWEATMSYAPTGPTVLRSLRLAVEEALSMAPPDRPTASEQHGRTAGIRDAHAGIYQAVLDA